MLTRPLIARMAPAVASGQTLDYNIRALATARAGTRRGGVERHDIIAVFEARKG
jgi:hypothetical protein